MADNLSIYKTHHIANATPSATVSTQTSGLYHALAPVFLVRIVQDTPSPPFQTQQVGPSVKWAFFWRSFSPFPPTSGEQMVRDAPPSPAETKIDNLRPPLLRDKRGRMCLLTAASPLGARASSGSRPPHRYAGASQGFIAGVCVSCMHGPPGSCHRVLCTS